MDEKLKKKLMELFELTADINGTKERKAEDGKPCIFIDWHGHVASITIHIHLDGWSTSDSMNYLEYEIELYRHHRDARVEDNLNAAIARLQKIKEENNDKE